jgi:regulator of nonsense transcripts 2
LSTPGTNPIDLPQDMIRTRIVLTILETCGQYFEKGSLKKKCDIFLLFFQVNELYN